VNYGPRTEDKERRNSPSDKGNYTGHSLRSAV